MAEAALAQAVQTTGEREDGPVTEPIQIRSYVKTSGRQCSAKFTTLADGRVQVMWRDSAGVAVASMIFKDDEEALGYAGDLAAFVSAPAPTPTPTPTPTPSTGVYWGGRIGYPDLNPSDAPWSTAAIDRFEANAGKQISYLQFGQRFGAFDAAALTTVRNRGAIPHVEMMTKLPDGTSLTVTQIKDGAGDALFKAFCEKAKAWQYPFVFRWLWEFNGPWQDTYYGYNTTMAYSRPADYVAAWRRLHGIAQAVGATNMTWLWCPNWWRTGTSAKDPSPWWVGDAYVDMLGIDGYADGYTVTQIMEVTYPWIAQRLNGKPFYYETGCYEAGAAGSHVPPSGWSKAQWINDLFARLPSYPLISVLNWFNDQEAGRPSEAIETSPAAQAAFKAGIADARYLASAPAFPALTKFGAP